MGKKEVKSKYLGIVCVEDSDEFEDDNIKEVKELVKDFDSLLGRNLKSLGKKIISDGSNDIIIVSKEDYCVSFYWKRNSNSLFINFYSEEDESSENGLITLEVYKEGSSLKTRSVRENGDSAIYVWNIKDWLLALEDAFVDADVFFKEHSVKVKQQSAISLEEVYHNTGLTLNEAITELAKRGYNKSDIIKSIIISLGNVKWED